MKPTPAKMPRHLFFFTLMWATLFVLGLIVIVSRHVTSLGTFHWSSALRKTDDSLLNVFNNTHVKTFNNTYVTAPSVIERILHEHRYTENSRTWTETSDGSEDAAKVEGTFSPRSVVKQVMLEISRTSSVSTLHSRHLFQCKEETTTNIVFIKVHKSGSTTVANVLARYTLRHNLNVVLPNRSPGKPRFNYFPSGPLDNHVIPGPRNEHYHVLFNHMIYNRSTLDDVMPEETFYCGIMREPLSRFTSSINYYHLMLPPIIKQYLLFGSKALPRRPNTKQAAPAYQPTRQQVDLRTLLTGPERARVERCCEVFNSLACNTGLPRGLYTNYSAVLQHTLKLDRELDLMMVMEHFDESLVLLKRRACLELEDILYLRLNSARSNSVRKLIEDDERTMRSWQAADHFIYEFFYKKFRKEVGKEGGTFWLEVGVFRKILNRTQTFCDRLSLGLVDVLKVLKVPASSWNMEFTVTAKDCELMRLKEVVMQRRLISRAWRMVAETHSDPDRPPTLSVPRDKDTT